MEWLIIGAFFTIFGGWLSIWVALVTVTPQLIRENEPGR